MSEKEHDDELVLDRAVEVVQVNEARAAAAPPPSTVASGMPEAPVDFPEPPGPPPPGLAERVQRWLRLAAPVVALAAVAVLFGNVWSPAWRSLRADSGKSLVHDLVPAADPGSRGPGSRSTPGKRLPVLFVNSTPAGARVAVDGIDQGPTPVATTIECAPGRVELLVIVRLDGFKSWTRQVSCVGPRDLVLDATLEPVRAKVP
jgi:hypothetical protein